MPRLEDLAQHPMDTIIASIGGAVFRPERINVDFTHDLLAFLQEQTKNNRTILAVIGGGGVARNAIEDARALGVTHQPSLDRIGILVTQENALLLAKIIEAKSQNISVRLYEFGDILRKGVIYLRGGTQPGHTTDYVAVQIAAEANQCVLLNISSPKGLYRKKEVGALDPEQIIERISWNEYLAMFPGNHAPGINIPFDREAAKLAQTNDMTVVLMGPDFDNINRFLSGQEFTGTVIHP
jgi:uridylate kinase